MQLVFETLTRRSACDLSLEGEVTRMKEWWVCRTSVPTSLWAAPRYNLTTVPRSAES